MLIGKNIFGIVLFPIGLIFLALLLKRVVLPFFRLKDLRKIGVQVSFWQLVKDSQAYPLGLVCESARLLHENEIDFDYKQLTYLFIDRPPEHLKIIRHAVQKIKIERTMKSLTQAVQDYQHQNYHGR